MDQAAFLRFLLETSRRGYAAGSSAIKTREADQSTTIVLEQGEWRFHDNYFGGEPYGGREVVFFRGQPVWMAVYYGYVQKNATVDSVYSFLQRALRDAPADFPVRGPEALTDGRHIETSTTVTWTASLVTRRSRRPAKWSTPPIMRAGLSIDGPAIEYSALKSA